MSNLHLETVSPAISVILPVYNGGGYLVESVQSVLNQDFLNFELLILDDCSTDQSWTYINSLDDPRVRIWKNEQNKGLFYNLNFLVQKATSPLVKLWAQDDSMYSHCLQEFVQFHHANPGVGFSYSGRDHMDENGTVNAAATIDHTPHLISTNLHARIAFFTGSIAGNIANVCINKVAMETVGPFNEQMQVSADFDMWVRLAKEHPVGFLPQKLIKLRDHARQLSRKESLYINNVREDLQVYRYLKSYVPPGIWKEGKYLLRNHKMVYYYTLMLKTLLAGKTATGLAFFWELARFDNFLVLTTCYLRAKVWPLKLPSFANGEDLKA